MPIYPTPIPASDTYSADEDIDNAYGSLNATAWAALNPDADAGEIAARKAWARDEAKILIDEALAAAGLTVPATAETFQFFSSLRSIEAQLAGAILYQSRGVTDRQGQQGDMDGAMQAAYDRAAARLVKLIEAAAALDDDDATAAAGTFRSVPIVRRGGCATDEFASN
jgi:hypothetical protein